MAARTKKEDPFAVKANTEDEKDTTVSTETTEAPISSSGEVSVTLKGGSGFDAPWVVIRAGSVADALDQLHDDETLKALLDKAAKVGGYFAGLAPKSSGGGGGNGGARPARQEAPNGESRQCTHGEMTFRSGVSKKSGKPYKMFTCNSGDRNDECPPQFLN